MNKKSWIIIVIEALVFIILLGTISKCSYDKIDRLENNIEAYRDTMEYVELQNLELLTTKQSLILSEAELRNELDISKKEMKDLKKKLGDNVAYITKLEAQINIKDTIFLKGDTVYINKIDSTITKRFSWSNIWLNMNATINGTNISDSKLFINDFNMKVPLDVGLTDDYKFWVKTSNPHVIITNINSAVVHGSSIAKKDKRFHHGVHIGLGLHYGMIGQRLDIGPQAGYGFTYSF